MAITIQQYSVMENYLEMAANLRSISVRLEDARQKMIARGKTL